jgi:hypothetical protein
VNLTVSLDILETDSFTPTGNQTKIPQLSSHLPCNYTDCAILAHELLYEQYIQILMKHPRGTPRSEWAHRLEAVTQKKMDESERKRR